MIRVLPLMIIIVTMITCRNAKSPIEEQSELPPLPKTILCLGDSYTIGQSVSEAERWPNQLARSLELDGVSVAAPKIIARTGWTTAELLTAILANPPDSTYHLVTLLIGVNDQYRGLSIDVYRQGFSKLLALAIQFAQNDPERVIVLSIPDYSVTPFVRRADTVRIRQELDQFNALNRQLSVAAGAFYIDITPISRKARQDSNYLASDGLHPSGKMYAEWVELILPVAKKILRQ